MVMNEYPSVLLERAVAQMSSLPGVGRKTALRYVLGLLRRSPEAVISIWCAWWKTFRISC